MSEVKLTAEKRTEFGKGAARRLRRESKVPAVLYGHGTDPLHLALPGHDTMMALKHSNQLLTLDLGGGKTELALPKDVQRHAIKDVIEHVDLLMVRRGEKVTVDVPLHVVGDAAAGTMVMSEMTTLSIEVEATQIPNSLDVDVTGLAAGSHISAADVALPSGATLVADPEALVLNVVAPTDADLGEDADAGAESGDDAGSSDDAGAPADGE